MADRMLLHDMKSCVFSIHCRSNSQAAETVSSGHAHAVQVRFKLCSPMDLIVKNLLMTLEMLQVPLWCFAVLRHGERYEYKRLETMFPPND
jgi:hypothetical protein